MEFAPKLLYGRDPRYGCYSTSRSTKPSGNCTRWRACLREYSDVECLDVGHVVHIIRSGGDARRSAA